MSKLFSFSRTRSVTSTCCDQQDAPPRHTVVSAPQVAIVVASVALMFGCGSKPGADTYAKAAATQQTCCENLQGADRDSCLNNIIKIEDEQVAATNENRATFSCVQNNFVCDPATGHATQESAQLQLDCIQGLK